MTDKNKKQKQFTFVEKMQKIAISGLENAPAANRDNANIDTIAPLEERITHLFNLIKNPNRGQGNMLFFVMYDIQSNKVRHQVVKYLMQKGCYRVQKSIFLADLKPNNYEQIKKDLTEVQACYKNNDSILIVPISTDYLNAMKIIGKNIEVDLIKGNKNTLFF